MKRLLTAADELAKRVETLEHQNNTLIHRLKMVEQKDTGSQGGTDLSSQVRDLAQANTEIRQNMRKLSEDTHETLGPVRLKTIFETFLGEWGWKGSHRAHWCEQYKEKDGLLTNKTLMYLNNTYATENPENTTHSTTFSKGYAAVEMEYESGRMGDDDYLAFLAMLAYLYNKHTKTSDTNIDAIRRTVLDSKERIQLRRVLRGSSIHLRAPRPKPMGHSIVKGGEKVDEKWIANCGVGRDEIGKELEDDGVVLKELVSQAVSPLSTKGGKVEKKTKAKDTGHSKKGLKGNNIRRESVERPGWK